ARRPRRRRAGAPAGCAGTHAHPARAPRSGYRTGRRRLVGEQQRDGAVVSTAEARTSSEEIPPDNRTRLAIFDAMHKARKDGRFALTVEELHERVLPRLRVLVPRELHIAG